jgi:hypothetical protein
MAAVAIALLGAPAASAADPRIEGEAVEGATLRAIWKDHGPDARYEWVHAPASNCRGGGDDDEDRDEDDDDRASTALAGPNGNEYTLEAGDVGQRLVVRVWRGDERKPRCSSPTATVVPAPVRPAAPPPSAFPSPSGQTPAVTSARYLRPFPVVRIKGFVRNRGARVTLLRVTAPRRARVRVRCAGRGCPVRRLARGRGRIGAFERFLRARTRITIRVTRPGFVGKHVRLVVRSARPPARRDACVLPGSARAVACPAA